MKTTIESLVRYLLIVVLAYATGRALALFIDLSQTINRSSTPTINILASTFKTRAAAIVMIVAATLSLLIILAIFKTIEEQEEEAVT